MDGQVVKSPLHANIVVCIERSELRGAIASEGFKKTILQIDQYGFEFSRAPH
jgi:hypothetical protein